MGWLSETYSAVVPGGMPWPATSQSEEDVATHQLPGAKPSRDFATDNYVS